MAGYLELNTHKSLSGILFLCKQSQQSKIYNFPHEAPGKLMQEDSLAVQEVWS